MLRLIHGNNYYISHKHLLELKKNSKDTEYAIIDGDTIRDSAEIFVKDQSFGMFKTSTVTIVKRFFKNPKKISLEKKIIEELSKSDLANIELIFWEDQDLFEKKKKSKPKATGKKPRATSKLDTYLKNNAQIELNEEFSQREIEEWIRGQFIKESIKISTNTLEKFIQRVGINLAILDSEVEKLILFMKSEHRSEITLNDIETITSLYIQDYKIWDLTDAFFDKNKKKALDVLDSLLVVPARDFPMIIGSLLKQIKTIYLVKKYLNDQRRVMSKLRMPPYAYYKAENLAKKIDINSLKLMYRKFIDLDYSIKQGKIDVKLGLDLLIITLS